MQRSKFFYHTKKGKDKLLLHVTFGLVVLDSCEERWHISHFITPTVYIVYVFEVHHQGDGFGAGCSVYSLSPALLNPSKTIEGAEFVFSCYTSSGEYNFLDVDYLDSGVSEHRSIYFTSFNKLVCNPLFTKQVLWLPHDKELGSTGHTKMYTCTSHSRSVIKTREKYSFRFLYRRSENYRIRLLRQSGPSSRKHFDFWGKNVEEAWLSVSICEESYEKKKKRSNAGAALPEGEWIRGKYRSRDRRGWRIQGWDDHSGSGLRRGSCCSHPARWKTVKGKQRAIGVRACMVSWQCKINMAILVSHRSETRRIGWNIAQTHHTRLRVFYFHIFFIILPKFLILYYHDSKPL